MSDHDHPIKDVYSSLAKLSLDSPNAQDARSTDIPSVVEHQLFDPDADAVALYGAMRGLGTREKAIIELLSTRTNEQRQRIAISYKNIYKFTSIFRLIIINFPIFWSGMDKIISASPYVPRYEIFHSDTYPYLCLLTHIFQDIISAMKGELKIIISGHFEDVIIALFKVPETYDAEQIHHAIHLPLSDEDMLINILCSRNNEEITILKGSYRMLYDHDLLPAIGEHVHTSAFFKTLLAAVLQATRDERPESSDAGETMKMIEQAKWDAKTLYDAGPKRWASETAFIPIFISRSYGHLRVVFEELEKLTNLEVEKVISNEVHSDIGKFLICLVKYIKNKYKFFAEVLFKSMKGLGTHDRKLMHTVISRCEKDLGSVRHEFDRMYAPKTLESFIIGDTSGYYKNILLALSGCKKESTGVNSPKSSVSKESVRSPSSLQKTPSDDYY